MHQHKCSLCGTLWQHGEEWDRDMLAHECPVCGCHQFRVFKVDDGETAATPEQTYDKMVEAFASADPFVRSTTLFTLIVSDRAAQNVLPNLATMATADPEVMVRLAAVETLRRFGAGAVAALPALAQALADRHPEVRRAAALTLGDLGSAAESALTALTGRLNDIHPRVRTVVAAALAKIQPMTGVWQITVGHG
jgi:HEAT repeat protein